LNSPGKSILYLFKLTSLNRHEHTNIQTTGNNKNETGDVTHSAAANIFAAVPSNSCGNYMDIAEKVFGTASYI